MVYAMNLYYQYASGVSLCFHFHLPTSLIRTEIGQPPDHYVPPISSIARSPRWTSLCPYFHLGQCSLYASPSIPILTIKKNRVCSSMELIRGFSKESVLLPSMGRQMAEAIPTRLSRISPRSICVATFLEILQLPIRSRWYQVII
jgi:hypothetical protein